MANKENSNAPLILFDVSKKEIAHPESNYVKLASRLRQRFKISVNREGISPKELAHASLLILAGPQEMFSHEEFNAIKEYITAGGSVLILLSEGGETKLNTNLNYLLEDYGISVNNDSVIRTVYYKKYFHPKECFVSHGVINNEIVRVARGQPKKDKPGVLSNRIASNLLRDDTMDTRDDHGGLNFVFPFGASLNVQKPASPILSSGPISYPINRPVAAIYTPKARKGRLLVCGSVSLFADDYLDKEDNSKLQDIFFRWLLHDDCDLDLGIDDDNDIQDYNVIPDIGSMSENLKCCLQQSEDIPINFRSMFDDKLFKFDTDLIPEAIKLFEELAVKHEALTLIPPTFETPLPSLLPAVFPPNLKDMPPPSLELFDLDEQFASEK
jgi:intraflagellar transport protein 52